VRGGERPRLVLPNLVSGSAQDSTCELAITRSDYRTVLVMTKYLPDQGRHFLTVRADAGGWRLFRAGKGWR
jgi:hypothetical protein